MNPSVSRSVNFCRSPVPGTVVALIIFATNYPVSAQQHVSDESSQPALTEVVVTGSRISRAELETPTPTTVINSELIQNLGVTNVIDAVQQFPQLGRGNNNTNTNFSFGNVGLSQLDLRDLGTNRTLTLINGLRRVGTPDDRNFLAVDVGIIPTALVDRVEIQTGGTAAVYGADAVAGVVNFILKDHFEGVQVQAQYGTDGHSNYNDTLFSVTAGHNFDHANVVFNITHDENSRLWYRDRNLTHPDVFVSNPAGDPKFIRLRQASYPYFGIPTPTTNDAAFGGAAIFDSKLNDFRPFNASNSPRGIIDGSYSAGPDGGTGNESRSRIAPLRRTTAYGKASIDVTSNIKLINELMFSQSYASDSVGPAFDASSAFVSTSNPYMPAAVRQSLLAAGEDGFTFSREEDEFGPRVSQLSRQFYSWLGGLEGELASKYKWSVTAEYGRTQTSNTQLNDRLDAHWYNALDAIADPVTGQPECADAQARAQGCVPINVFGAGTISNEALAYVRAAPHTTYTYTSQRVAQAVISGPIVDLPAGPLKFAAGLEYRDDALHFEPSSIWQNALGFFATQFEPVSASNNVKEGFTELLVPVLKDLPFAKVLEIEGAYRYSKYQRAGGVNTDKIGFTWAPVSDVRFRGTKALTVRAPALGEMFNPGSRGANTLNDPCDPLYLDTGSSYRRANCAALGLNPTTFDPNTRRVRTLVLTSGNPDLEVEKANALTAGVVLQPHWVPNLTVTADWYDINLHNGIVRLGEQQVLDDCVDLPSVSNQFCNLIDRDSTGNIAQLRNSYVNVSGYRVRGVDFEIAYAANLNALHSGAGNWGTLRMVLDGNHQITNAYIDKDPGTGQNTTSDYAGEYDYPAWRAVLNLAYQRDPVTVSWYTRWVGTTVIDPTITNGVEQYGALYHLPSAIYHNASVTYDTPWNIKLTAGMNNIFDRGPRDNPRTRSGYLSYDDIIGRFVYFRLIANFAGAH